uniref:Kazal-like domain-containing protein n=1 Tax=Astatotilapia calliptera TaxID=8154 RepID=A0A3P8QG58_ASTCA
MCVSSRPQLCLCLCMHGCNGARSPRLQTQHHIRLQLWEEVEGRRECDEHLCPPVPDSCSADWVQDTYRCCKLYDHCGDCLGCQIKLPKKGHRTKPEPSCACQEKVPVCGSDGWTHPSICQLREAASSSNTTKNLSRRGPCYSSPINLSSYPGSDITFGCESAAYPLPGLNRRRTGTDFLTGDDPNISFNTPSSRNHLIKNTKEYLN